MRTRIIDVYTCPQCREPLRELRCEHCQRDYPRVEGFPILLPASDELGLARDIAGTYDEIYRADVNVWERVGRTKEFIRYFSSLLAELGGGRLLEIGCGEGHLLAAVDGTEKHATDLSVEALKRAQDRENDVHFCIALAETLPFPDGYFDLVVAVGVMEHFLDTDRALREISRVLKPGGQFVNLLHVKLTLPERIQGKVRQFVFPRLRPVAFANWLRESFARPDSPQAPKQPIQNRYTTQAAGRLLERKGFELTRMIHRRKFPELPLAGNQVVIFVARK